MDNQLAEVDIYSTIVLMMSKKTKCTYCGQESENQAPGNGCHTCLKGIMKEVSAT